MAHLGPFQLHGPVARGGTATVWRARHVRRGVPVAVKVLLAPEARDGASLGWRARLAGEVQAIARLGHRGIIRLHDQALIPPAVAAETGLPEGAPYLVMQWIGGGTLRDTRCRDWSALRATLLELLDALAYAHAHGVVHRDLKPDNVLLAERGPVISDFGLALAAESRGEGEGRLSGTPGYMAPEQIRCAWWACGPATDLYALGCLAWERICGHTPFAPLASPGLWGLLDAHLVGRLPPLSPRLAVPLGIDRWLARLLAPDPGRRFVFAADAAAALRALGPATGVGSIPVVGAALPTLVDGLGFATTMGDSIDRPAPVHPTAPVSMDSPPPSARPRMPSDWRGAEPPDPPLLLDVGRSVGRLRTPPPVGRSAERDVLWQALAAVVDGATRVVVIEGPAGIGKRHLATWIQRRAHALGLADGLAAHHEAGPDGGLGPMFARRFRCRDADGAERRRRIAGALALDPSLLDAAVAVIGGEGDAAERRGVFAGLIAALCARRPLVVRIDDGQWAPEAVALVGALRARRLPALVVVTVRDDALGGAEAVSTRRWAAEAMLHPGPLPAADLARMVRSVLPLEAALVERVVERAAGSPLFAIELVREWADSLEPGPRGFRPRGDTTLAMPAGMGAVWRARLDRALPEDATEAAALELAAVLGVVVEPGELRAACAVGGLVAPGLPAVLIEQRLAVLHGTERWAFAHPMLREALLARAEAGGRLARWHACAADALPDREALRRARHLVAAGRPSDAWDPLMRAAGRAVMRAEASTLRRCLTRAVALHRSLGHGLDQPGWARIATRGLVLAMLDGRYPAALRRAPAVIQRVEATGDRGLWVEAMLVYGGALHASGAPDAAREAQCRALDEAEGLGDRLLIARTASRAGWIEAERGAVDAAEGLLRRSVAVLDGLDDEQVRVLRANALRNLADLGRRAGRPDALALAERAIEAYRAAGLRRPVAQMQVIVGDLLRYAGRLDEAGERYRAAVAGMRAIDAPEAPFAEANLALVLMALDRPAEARASLVRLIEADPGEGPSAIAAMIARAVVLPCDALAEDWTAWDSRFGGMGPVADGRLSDPDVAEAARRAAALAERRGQHARAALARALAAVQFEALGRREEAAEMRAGLAADQ